MHFALNPDKGKMHKRQRPEHVVSKKEISLIKILTEKQKVGTLFAYIKLEQVMPRAKSLMH